MSKCFKKILDESSRFHLLLLLQTSEDFEGNRATLNYYKGIIAARDSKALSRTLKGRCVNDMVFLIKKSNHDNYSDSFSKEEDASCRVNTQPVERMVGTHNFGARKGLSHQDLRSQDGVSEIPPLNPGKNSLKMEISDEPTALNFRGQMVSADALDK